MGSGLAAKCLLPYFEIIGIIADAKNTGLQDAPRPEVYFPYTVTGTGPPEIMVRTESNSSLVLESLRREIAGMDSDVAVSDAGSMRLFLNAGITLGHNSRSLF